jgi:NAD(P)-dependent dehydrogenase (short-subunit alcohol dehydrogenase family)
VFNVNVAGALRVITTFLPLVKKSQKKVVVTISSIGGSHACQPALIEYYSTAGVPAPLFYAYRVSKAALNFSK